MFKQRRSILRYVGAIVLGCVLTFGLSWIFQLYTFQSDFYRAYYVFQKLSKDYLWSVPEEQLIEGAVNGMLTPLNDPYTSYITGKEAEALNEQFYSEFEGIGADIRIKDGQVQVISPVRGAPAEKAGLQPNDILLEVDGVPLGGKNLDEAASVIRGPKGSEITILVRRPGIEADFKVTMKRGTIPTETITYEMLPNQIAHIRISEFASSTGSEFDAAVNDVTDKQARGIILDLRRNPGGMAEEMIHIADYFVPKGELIMEQRDRNGKAERRVADRDPLGLPTVVLVDEGSASSSEVLALALKESAGVPLIGQRTFGKGIGQSSHYFRDGAVFNYTNIEVVSPNGVKYHGVGVEPDYQVALPAYAKLPLLTVVTAYQMGDKGTEIGLAQQYLQALGFDPMRTDGVFDEQTKEAVMGLQSKAGLPPSGRLDVKTGSALTEMLKTAAEDNDTQLKKAVELMNWFLSK